MKNSVSTNFLKIVSKKSNQRVKGIVSSTLKDFPPLKKSLTLKFYSYRRLIYGISEFRNHFLLRFNDVFLERLDLFEIIFPVLYGDILNKGKVLKIQNTLSPFLREIEKLISFKKYEKYFSTGEYYNLVSISRDFSQEFEKYGIKNIFWSKKKAKKRLGYADLENGVIVISRIFDSEDVPSYVIKTLIYHELLHFKFPPERWGKNRVQHSKKFREIEKKYKFYEDTMKFLERYLS